MSLKQNDKQLLILELAELKQEHRELDNMIRQISEQDHINQLEVSRLKKQKLKLKDGIARLESNLIPDLHA